MVTTCAFMCIHTYKHITHVRIRTQNLHMYVRVHNCTITCPHTYTVHFTKLVLNWYTHIQIEAWISEKMQVATDESYKDPTNLEGKLQKHQKFEAEITPNEQRIHAIAQVSLSGYSHSLYVYGRNLSYSITHYSMTPLTSIIQTIMVQPIRLLNEHGVCQQCTEGMHFSSYVVCTYTHTHHREQCVLPCSQIVVLLLLRLVSL